MVNSVFHRILPCLRCKWDDLTLFLTLARPCPSMPFLHRLWSKSGSKGEKNATKIVGQAGGNLYSPGAPHLFERTLNYTLLSDKQIKISDTQLAILNSMRAHGGPDITATEDDKILDRVIFYLRATRNMPLQLGCDMPPQVKVTIDAAFANCDIMWW